MAQDPAQVISFLNELALASKAQGEKELATLTTYAKAQHGVAQLNAWDITYYSEKQKQDLYQISDEALRPYFPENTVLAGLFYTLERLFSVKVSERHDVDTWHKMCVSICLKPMAAYAAALFGLIRASTSAAVHGWMTAKVVACLIACKSGGLPDL